MNRNKQADWKGTAVWDQLGRLGDGIVLWITAKGFAAAVALMLSLAGKRRMSHDNGIAGKGLIRILDNPSIPRHPFFLPGRTFPCRIRHATATFLDDAVKGIRSMSIKFSDHHLRSPLDLQMNTGEISLFWSAASFLQFAKLRKQQWGVEYREYYRKYPSGLRGAEVAIRENPTSFHDLRYYCKTPFLFIGEDNIRRYAKYRVLPYDERPETGILKNPDTTDITNQRVPPHDPRGRNYLKYEYEDRVREEGAKYRLQIQLHPSAADEDPEIFNNMKPWDDKLYPWQDLAVIDIEETLDWNESCRTTFEVSNMPKSLGILPARSVYDYNSLNYLRAHSSIARRVRLLNYRMFGYPPPIPDNDNRNFSDWEKPPRIFNRTYSAPAKTP